MSSTPFDDSSAAAGVTEIRVHGVGGATPEQMLGQTSTRQVSGDRLAGFYRLDELPHSRRHVEAYSWGGLTSRSRSRALWVFLLPFVLANMAGWASQPRPPVPEADAPIPPTKPETIFRRFWQLILRLGGRLYETKESPTGPVHAFRLAATKMAGLALTLSVLLIICLLSIDVLGYQCGAQQGCANSSWWLAPLTWGDLRLDPSRRLVVGSLVPIAVIAVFAILSFTSRTRYERIDPPERDGQKSAVTAENRRSAVYLPNGLADQRFWEGRAAHARLSRVHLSAGIAMVAVVLGLCSLHTSELVPGGATDTALRTAGFALAGAALLLAIVLLQRDWEHSWPSGGALILAMIGFVAVGWSAWQQPAVKDPMAGQTPGIVLAFNLTWIVIGLLLLPLLLTLKLKREKSPAGVFRWLQPFPMLAFGILLAHIVLLGVLVFVTGLLSPVTQSDEIFESPVGVCQSQAASIVYVNEIHCAAPDGGPAVPLMLPPMVETSISYFVWLGLLILAGFAAFGVWRYWRAGRGANLDRLMKARRPPPGSDGEKREPVDDYLAEEVQFEDLPEDDDRRIWRQDAVTQQSPDKRDATGWRFALRRQLRQKVIDRRPDSANATQWTRQRARWEFLGRSSAAVSVLISIMVAVAVCVVLIVWIMIFFLEMSPPSLAPELAAKIAVAIPPALFAFILLSWRQLERRRILGTLWDVGTFWPRSLHPFAPPCYAERAVPELTRRVWWLNNNTGKVVLAAHSQGAVIAAATALRGDLSGADAPKFGLVTFGAPLRKLYGQAFPAFWSQNRIEQLTRPDQSLVCQRISPTKQSQPSSRWTNVFYFTDYIGGAVNVDDVDQRLPDPAHRFYVYGQQPDKVMSHTGYWQDPKFRGVVDTMMDDIDPPPPSAAVGMNRSSNGHSPSVRHAGGSAEVGA
jgi:hypothetical protein